MTILWAAGLLLLAYLAGSLPTGYWMGLTKGIDIRTVGSGSTGATNVLRSVGKMEALVVFIIDIAKGYLPVWWAMVLEPSLWSSLGLPPYTIPVAVALMPVLGHSRSIFLGFKGGKSAATGLGTFLALNPLAAGIVFATWLGILAVWRIVSLASISASAAAPFVAYFCGSPPTIVGFAVVGALYVILRHRANLTRLMNGTEPRIGKKAGGGLMAPVLDPMIGRYVRLDIEGVAHRVYFEEAGPEGGGGIPLVCLHTAGADSRQFRHLLADPAVTERYRVLAFDMPWHGKSTPPDGWERTEYRLTTASYTAAVRAFCRAMDLDKPVVMGCSIGGRIVLNLAIGHAAEFRALIALEAADFQQPWYDTAWLHRPDVHGGEVCAALISGLIAPQSPAVSRHETLWMYMQGGPGIFKGDLYFYRVDGDLREKVKTIDTKVCPLYLLTGEYDFSCTAEDTLRTAAQIPGVEVQVMKELGHFPMSENPARFREYILPVLAKIS